MSILGVLMLAVSTVVTPPAPGGAADGETSTNAVLSLRPDGNVFRLTFAVEATPSNNVELALGADRNADGDLSTDETDFLIGWRGDRWVAFDAAGEQVAEAVSPGGATELRWTVRLRDKTAVPRSTGRRRSPRGRRIRRAASSAPTGRTPRSSCGAKALRTGASRCGVSTGVSC